MGSMIDIIELPSELREMIWTKYRDDLRTRRADYVLRDLVGQIHALCQTDAELNFVLDWMAHMIQFPNDANTGLLHL